MVAKSARSEAVPAEKTVVAAALDEKSGEVITLEKDGSIHAWGGRSLQPLRSNSVGIKIKYGRLALVGDGEYIEILARSSSTMTVLRRSDFSRIWPKGPKKLADATKLIRNDAEFYIWAVDDKEAEFWKAGPVPPRRLSDFAFEEVRDFVIDRSGNRLVVRKTSGDVELWDVPEGRRLATLEHSGSRALGVSASLDGNALYIPHADGALTVYRINDGSRIAQLNNLSTAAMVLYHNDKLRRIHVWTQEGFVLRYTEGTSLPWWGFIPSVSQPPEPPRRCVNSAAAIGRKPNSGITVDAGVFDAAASDGVK
jgi:WD40 repeat protein